MRERWVEITFQEFTNSSYEGIDRKAYSVWAKYNWWVVPWWHLVGGVAEGPFGVNSTTTSSSSSSTYSSWTSSVSSSVT